MSITPARGKQNGNCCHFVENLLYDPKTDPVGGHWDYNYKGSGSSQSKKRRSVQNKRGQYFQEW